MTSSSTQRYFRRWSGAWDHRVDVLAIAPGMVIAYPMARDTVAI